jgi:ribose 5-phosphate isomerase B
VLAFGGRIVGDTAAIDIVKRFLSAEFLGGRHERRIEKIAEMDRARSQSAKSG